MPTSANNPEVFGQLADVGIRAPEQNRLLQKALTKYPTRRPWVEMSSAWARMSPPFHSS